MPLGASITFGFTSTDGNGYRSTLRNLITAGGNLVNMVGEYQNGTMQDNDVEAVVGLRIDEIYAKAQATVPQFLPNVILVNAGTNDCTQDWNMDQTTQLSTAAPSLTSTPTDDVGTRMQALLESLYAMSPDATVILSTLVVNGNAAAEANVLDANAKYKALAATLQALGRRLVVADMDTDQGPQPTQLVDGTHPTDAGYQEMANVWYNALIEASARGFLQPATNNGIPADGAA